MEKGCFIKEIQDNQPVAGLFLVKEMTRSETKTGKPYLTLALMDNSGEIGARIWEDADRLMTECPTGSVVAVNGQAQSYKNILQLKINEIKAVTKEEADLTLLMPSAPGDIKAMACELLKLAKSVEDPDFQHLLLLFFKNRKTFDLFKKAPAAKYMHHAYNGGLLEHTLGVARLADNIARIYPEMDRSLLLSGALLHDIGKLVEFSFDSFPFDYSDKGRLVGHMVLGIEMIQDRIAEIPKFPDEKATRLKHLILSHHGRHEFGSPTLPMMMEAFVLNFLDDLDAKINYMNRLGSQASEPGYQWTDFQRNLDRFLFVKGHDSQSKNEQDPQDDNGIDPRQRNLWQG
ncbi:MAG: 3'-5' exoribonuclease YhaM family protein [Proteobacteria bacterium]|nr:3'-5' exoribonuclease YhaM family protein [Pseudomonadota bacterium]MBU1716416.1 3'-5' exoribonuclease YhaM family protein [Pseudomonadota bacterium]